MLQRATHATLSVLAARLGNLGLTSSEINVLANLADGRPRVIATLCADVGSKPSTLTSVLDRLERRELITRGPGYGDRRAVSIELTSSGRATAAKIREVIREIEERAIWNLPDDVVAGARTILDALAEQAR